MSKHKLVLDNMGTVKAIAYKMGGYRLPFEDLVQSGALGLVKAVERFDSSKNVRISTYASYWIKHEIYEFILRNWSIVRTGTTKPQKKLFFNMKSMTKGFCVTPDEAARMAKELNVKDRDIKVMEQRLFTGNDCSFEEHCEQSMGEMALEEVDLNDFLNDLDVREKDIITQRYILDESRKLKELAQQYGISIERVRQIERKALGKLKKLLTLPE